jgi:hypothetical protein
MTEAQFHVRLIPPELIARFWPFAEPFIKRALDHTSGEWGVQDLRKFCEENKLQLWLVAEGDRVVAALTTELVNYPHRKHCRIVTLAGAKAPLWTPVADTIVSNWALAQGCDALEAFVRKGYVPVLAKYGFQHKYSVIAKDINHGRTIQ